MIRFATTLINKIPKNKYSHLGKNICYVLLGNIGTRLLGFIMLPFYTRILNSSDYGTMDLIATYATMLLGFVTCQIQDSVFVFSSGKDFRLKSVYFSGGGFLCVVSFMLWACIFKGIRLLCSQESFWYKNVWYIFLYLFGLSFLNYMQQFCRSIDKMSIFAFSGFISGLAIVILAVYVLPRYPNGITMILIQVVGSLIAGIFIIISIGAWKYITYHFNFFHIWKEMLKYSLPIVPAPIMCWVLSSFNRPLLEKYCSLDAVGFFAVAIKIPSIIAMVWTIAGSAWQVSVMEEFFKKNFEDFYNRIFYLLVEGLCVLTFLLSVFSPFYMKYIVSSSFYECNKYIPILSVGSCLFVLGAMVGTIYLPPKKSKYFLYSSIVTLTVACITNLVMIPIWGMYGACISYLIGMLVEFVVRMYYSQKLARIRFRRSETIIILCTTFALFVFYFVPWSAIARIIYCVLGVISLIQLFKNHKEIFHR